MADYLYVLALALLPAFGNFAGGVLAEVIPTSRRMLSRALHAAAGIIVAVVATELMPEALGGAAPSWAIVLGVCLGGAFYVGPGILLIAAVEEMLGEAHEAAEDSRLSAGFFIGGLPCSRSWLRVSRGKADADHLRSWRVPSRHRFLEAR